MNIMRHFALSGMRTCTVPFEMTITQHGRRLLSNISKIPYHELRNEELDEKKRAYALKKMLSYFRAVSKSGGSFVYQPSRNTDGKYSIQDLQYLLAPFQFDAVLIDDLNNAKPRRGKSREEHLYYSAQDAVTMAKANDQIVILLTQLDPETKDIRYAKGIRDAVDWFWWFISDPAKRDADKPTPIEVVQGKAREGVAFPFPILADFPTLRMWGDPNTSQTMNRKMWADYQNSLRQDGLIEPAAKPKGRSRPSKRRSEDRRSNPNRRKKTAGR